MLAAPSCLHVLILDAVRRAHHTLRLRRACRDVLKFLCSTGPKVVTSEKKVSPTSKACTAVHH